MGVFIIITILVLSIMGYIPMSAIIFGILATLAVLCIGALSALPWIKKIEKKDYFKTAIVFTSLIAICCLLWIICVWLAVNMYIKLRDNSDASTLIKTLGFIKGTVIVTLQFMVASVVATCLTKFKKTMIPFQIITYVSYLFFDFYITFFLACIRYNKIEGEVQISETIKLLGNKLMLTLFILAIVYVAISNAVIKRIQERKAKEFVEDNYDKSIDIGTETEQEPKDSIQEKLESLKKMYEAELITKEEYEQKKSEILKDM